MNMASSTIASASTRFLAIVTKARSNSFELPTSTCWSSTCNALAAGSIALITGPLAGLPGFNRTPIRVALGTASLSNSSLFVTSSGKKNDEPRRHRIAGDRHHDRDRAGGLLGRLGPRRPVRDDEIHLEADELSRQLGK